METLFTITLFGAAIWFWISVLIFIFICFIADVNEEGYGATIALVIFGIAWYVWGDVKPLLTFITFTNVLVYLAIGFIFTTLRIFFKGRILWENIKHLPKDSSVSGGNYETQDYYKKNFLNELKENVTRWWFMWPISLITWIVSDLFKDLWNYLYSKFTGYFEYILNLGMKSAK